MNIPISIISCLVILIWICCLYRILITLIRFPPPRILKDEFQNDLPFVSILIPARNEEHNITHCIESLLKLDYPRYEIIVINDRSTDSTLAILRGLEQKSSLLRIVDIGTSEEGWSGKNYALHCGVAQAQGTWFLFSDADTEHCPQGLRLAIQVAREHNTGFLSFLSQMECHGFWENMIQPTACGLVTLLYPIEKVNDPDSSLAFANGQYILIKRVTYEEIGGHLGVKNCLGEDVVLAQEATKRGIFCRLAIGTYVVKTRMYRGFTASWNGWKRIVIHLNHGHPLPTLIRLTIAVFCMGILPLLVFMGALVLNAPPPICWLAGLALFFGVAVSWLFRLLSGHPQWPAVLIHLSALAIFGIFLNGIWDLLVGRKTNWRGVHYDVTQGRKKPDE
jgi:chlorobactene glucosyltransferase